MDLSNIGLENESRRVFSQDSDYEPNFLSSSGSNLASIFGIQPDGHTPLSKKQGAKKKPGLHSIPQITPSSKTEVIIAKAVHAFKLQNTQYVAIGKHGMALAGNATLKTYQIILYKSNQKHVSICSITPDFSYTVQPNNYSSYYDTNNDNWSVLFESNEVCTEFARHVGLARYMSRQQQTDDVICQNITAKCSPADHVKNVVAKEGARVSLKYFIATEIMQPFKTVPAAVETMTVEISTDDNWEKALIGTTKGLKTVLFIPPSKQIGLGPGFPKEQDIMLEIEIIDVVLQRERSVSPEVDASNKASIISRVAKMGQSVFASVPTSLPTGSIAVEPSRETEEERICELQQSSVQSVSETTITNRGINFLIPEDKMCHAKVRTEMYKIADIIESLLNQYDIEYIENAVRTNEHVMDIILEMVLAMNSYRTSQGELYKMPTTDKSMPDKNYRCDDKLLISMQEKDNRIGTLEIELNKLKDSLASTIERVNVIEEEKKATTHANIELSKKVERCETSLNDVNDKLRRMSVDLEKTNSLSDRYARQKDAMRNKIIELTKELDTMKSSMRATTQKEDDNKIKHIMNKAYMALLEKFEEESYSTEYIKSTIASTIRNITLQVLQEQHEDPDPCNSLQMDDVKIDDYELEKFGINSDASSVVTSEHESCTRNIPTSDEPPPIPPNDTDD